MRSLTLPVGMNLLGDCTPSSGKGGCRQGATFHDKNWVICIIYNVSANSTAMTGESNYCHTCILNSFLFLWNLNSECKYVITSTTIFKHSW